jgi:U3 small nucleolar RNA-associated protein 10
VEAAAVAAFVALTLRLTEARFKPLFFRILEWAEAVPAGDSGAHPRPPCWLHVLFPFLRML